MTSANPKPTQSCCREPEAQRGDAHPLRLVALRNVMLEPLEPALARHVRGLGHILRLDLGEYDNVFQESAGSPLLAEPADAVLVILHLEALSPDLAHGFNGLHPEMVDSEARRIEEHCAAVLDGIRRQTPALVLWAGFTTPAHPLQGILDGQAGTTQSAVVRRLNDFLRTILAQTPQACYLDLPLAAARVGLDQFFDPRFWHAWRTPYSRDGLEALAREIVRFLRPLKGKNRKCLVLDCDNTLWGGIVGEDGLAGIRLGSSHPGSAYAEFQRWALALSQRGIILALLSKNNEADVWEVFDRHPDMVLKREHIAAWRIDWSDKAANLAALARELNIGLDAMVLADDSAFERERVAQALPEVAVLALDPGRPEEYAGILASCGLFDTLTLSAEDRSRGAMYRAEAQRRRLRTELPDLGDYLQSLKMRAAFRAVDAMTVPRVAQQTQKTNQFNLTTRRYNEAQIKALAEDPDAGVYCLRLADRFGDAGIVAAAILHHEEGTARIDTFLVSCRALGRGVEDLFLALVLEEARARGCHRVVGEYWATAKNSQTADFYARMGFTEIPGAADRNFALDLAGALPALPGHFNLETEHDA